MLPNSQTIWATALAGALTWSASATADTSPKGIWYDHNGRGAVEIADCANGNGLCGYVVHVKNQKNADRCGMQILGNVTSRGGGWIYSPSRGNKYAVRLARLNEHQLRVVGNADSRFFSKTYTWQRASTDIEFCGDYAGRKGGKFTAAAVTAGRAKAPTQDQNLTPRPSEEIAITPDDEPSASEPLEGETRRQRIRRKIGSFIDRVRARRDTSAETGERNCKLRIPYVDRVVMIPCRD